MPDPCFDDARRALDEVAPTTDLWAAAQHRATVAATPMTAVAPRRSRWRWAIAAAVVGVPAIAVVALWPEPSQEVPVETGTSTSVPTPTTALLGSGTCSFAVTGDPIEFVDGPVAGSVPEQQSTVHATIGALTVQINVPSARFVRDFVGETVETVESDRGPLSVWLADNHVDAAWSGSDSDSCRSFNIEVQGGAQNQRRALAIELADRLVLPGDAPPSDGGPQTTPDTEPIGGPGQGFAIWPETALEDVPELSSDRRSGTFVAQEFARQVLGWPDAKVVAGQSEPSEDGRPYGGVHEVSSASRGTRVLVWVAPARLDGRNPFVYVVYHVDVPARLSDPDATASVQVLDGIASGDASPPTGTVRTRVRFAYQDHIVEAAPFEKVSVPSDQAPGSILVIWEGADGVLGAWGTALPQGDFAAG